MSLVHESLTVIQPHNNTRNRSKTCPGKPIPTRVIVLYSDIDLCQCNFVQLQECQNGIASISNLNRWKF